MCGIAIVLHKLGLFQKVIRDRILILRLPANVNYESFLAEPFRKYFDENHLISMESIENGASQELIFSVVLRRNAEPSVLIQELQSLNGGRKVSMVLGQQELDL
jgi:hypothetical protein